MPNPYLQTTGQSTPMPSVQLELGKYVVLVPRKDGTFHVKFQVPRRLRPSDWSWAIPLPRSGPRTGDLKDADQVAAIQRDAADLLEQLQRARSGLPRATPERSLSTLVRMWQESTAWKGMRPKTRKGYQTGINSILAWSEAKGHPNPTTMTRSAVEGFLALFDDKPPTKRATLDVLRMVMAQAVPDWRPDNPCAGIKVKVTKSKAEVWEQEDVDGYVAAAKAAGRPSIALIVLLEWEIGQRLTDVRSFRPGAEYNAVQGVFRFRQSKTNSYVTIPVSLELKELLALAADGALFLFRDESTGKAYTESRLTHVFTEIRGRAVAAGGRRLVLRHLRHSCVVQLARAECTIPEIASITGHSLKSVTQILEVYLPRDNQVAWRAQVKRGIIREPAPV